MNYDVVQHGSVTPNLSQILDGVPQGILVVRKNTQIIYANMNAEHLFHASESYLLRHQLAEILQPNSSVISLVNQVFEQQAPVSEYRIAVDSLRTRENWMADVYAAPIIGSPEYAILMFRERSVTDRIDSQLNHRGAARAVTGLAAMLGHEIKNPLSGIRGAAQLLRSVVPDEDRALADLITAETDRIVKIVDRMEVFSDERPIVREPVNMHSVMGHVRHLALNGFGAGIEISEDYDPSLPDVSGSKDALVQVFLNLVKNAAEAVQSTTGGKIKLSSAYRPGIRVTNPNSQTAKSLRLEFCVSDNGSGIPEDLRSHIFEPFVTTRLNGSGLGLALVAKIVEGHGGIIECDSSSEGSNFRILLPAWE